MGVLAGLGLLAMSGPASSAALSCVTGNNTVTVTSSNGCAPTPGLNDRQVDEDTLTFDPGSLGPYEWTYLDRDKQSNGILIDDDNNEIPGAEADWFFGSIIDPGSPGLAGCTQGDCKRGNRMRYLTLYGISGGTDVPEPGSLTLLGLGLLGLGMVRRRKAD
jgi:hypothetical protein